MKKLLLLALAALFSLQLKAQAPPVIECTTEITLTPMKNLPQQVFMFRSPGDPLTHPGGRLDSFVPLYLIYPDAPCNEQQSMDLIRSLGLDRQQLEFSIGVGVVNPIGATYDNDADLKAYHQLIDTLRVITNLKIIAIGRGATFVNQTIALQAEEVAGILSVGGKAGKASPGAVPVPAFIVGQNAEKVARPYLAANKAVLTGKQAHMQIYANAGEPLQRVVVSQATGQPLSEVFADAWDTVLSKNYRFNNYGHTFYEGQAHGMHGAYELEPFLMLDQLRVKRNIVLEHDATGKPTYLWYEYMPEGFASAAKGTVPLVLLLHGNNNDPRTQADTSGWIQLCASEKFMVAELEWQGKPGILAMGHDGVENTVLALLKKYPQLDASRIYTEGLSAGAMTSSALGIKKSHLFAAIGAMSGGLFSNRSPLGGDAILNEAIQKRGFVETAYIGVFGTDDKVINYPTAENWKGNSVINAWKIYETMNGLDVLENYDFGLDEAFGRTLRDRETVHTNKNISMETGQIYKGNVPLMKLVAVNHYGHWNFQPAAALMWDFFKHYSRNIETKRLEYHP